MELGIPVIMAVNMMDVVEKNGDKIHFDKLSKMLGCPVVEISALKNKGVKEMAEKAVELAKNKSAATHVHEFATDVENVIKNVEAKLGNDVVAEQRRFFAIKLLEKDDKIAQQLKSVPNVSEDIKALEDKFDDDTESIITNERYTYISSMRPLISSETLGTLFNCCAILSSFSRSLIAKNLLCSATTSLPNLASTFLITFSTSVANS